MNMLYPILKPSIKEETPTKPNNNNSKVVFLFVRLILLISLFILIHYLPAQNVSERINSLPDQQLKKLIEQAYQQGYTQDEVESIAKARGLSHSEILQLRERIKELYNSKHNTNQPDNTAVIRIEETSEEFEMVQMEEPPANSIHRTDRVYGSELFNSKNLSFNPSINIPTPEHYQLGPGDELIIDIWGASEQTYQVTISPEGYVKIPNLGPIFVSGLDINYASRKLISRLSTIYATLTDTQESPQATHAQVSLGRIRSIKVNVVGEVNKPGTYTVSSMSTVMHALYRAGGPAEMGSYRTIKIFRNSRHISTFDIYEFLLGGKHSQNIMLEEQDIIMIPNYSKRVRVIGEVKRPAIYELNETEALDDLIRYAGGLTDGGYSQHLTLKRKSFKAQKIITIKSGDFENYAMESGDEIVVASKLDLFENRVSINGAIWRPGEYELTEDLTLRKLITMAEGVTEDAFLKRGLILRENDDLTLRNIPFDVNEILNDSTADIALNPDDIVKIPSIFDLREKYEVTIRGEVRNPGTLSFEDSLTVEDLIVKSGGFKESAARSFVEVARKPDPENDPDQSQISQIYTFNIDEQLSVSKSASNFYLQPYDLVIVRKSPYASMRFMVEVKGEVPFPGKYAISDKKERISDLLARAGGPNNFAYLQGATLLRNRGNHANYDDSELDFIKEDTQRKIEKDSNDYELAHHNGYEFVNIDMPKVLKDPHGDEDLYLQRGDIIYIPRAQQTIHVNGEVFHPTTVRYVANKTFMHYIDQTGGFAKNAWAKKSYVIYSNGSAARTRNFLWIHKYPKVEPGAEIIVPLKPQRESMNVKEALTYLTSALTLGILLSRI